MPFFSPHCCKIDEGQTVPETAAVAEDRRGSRQAVQRDQIPKVHLPLEFDQVQSRLSQHVPGHLLLMAYEQENNQSLSQFVNLDPHVSVVIGPEGGFSLEEVEAVQKLDGKIIKLGNRILRTETAAVAVLALVQYLWGDLG